MKKRIIIGLFLLLPLFLFSPTQVRADNDDPNIPACNITMSGVSITPSSRPSISPTKKSADDKTSYFPFEVCITDQVMRQQADSCLQTGAEIKLSVNNGWLQWNEYTLSRDNYCFTTTLELDYNTLYMFNKMDIETEGGSCPKNTPLCQRVAANVDYRGPIIDDQEECQEAKDLFNCDNLSVEPSNIIVNQPSKFKFFVDPLLQDTGTCGYQYHILNYSIQAPSGGTDEYGDLQPGDNTIVYTPDILTGHKIIVTAFNSLLNKELKCEREFSVGTTSNPGGLGNSSGSGDTSGRGITPLEPYEVCKQIPEGTAERTQCETCIDQDGDDEPDAMWTAIGCIDTTTTEGIVGKLMTVGIGIAGGIALLMILAAAFLFATSEGEPKRTSEAKEILTSAIIGLIFIIFSVTILQFIGVNILKIPEFGAP